MGVRMTHPDSGGEYLAQPEQVPHLRSAGWQVAPGQENQGEEWPAELQRFDGQQQVRMRHPDIDGDPIVVAASAVPFHREKGWQVLEDEPPAEPAEDEDLEGLTVEELKERARDAGLPVSGTKAELLERLGAEQEVESPAEPASEEGDE
jgi:SAP domain-containing protein